MSKKRNSALRKEQDQYTMISNKQNQAYYQKHQEKKESNTISFSQAKQRKSVDLIPKSINQEAYILALKDPGTDIVIASGPAGTGKTHIATVAAVQALAAREVKRIVLCRPAVSIEGENHGFLPGTLTDKLAPWVRPITDILREFYSVKEIEHMIQEEIIEFASLGLWRGRTAKDTFLILDEAQNATPMQLKSLLTRIGEGSKIVITGDIEQSDRKSRDNGLGDLMARLQKHPINGMQVCEFTTGDIQRHRLIESILKLYN